MSRTEALSALPEEGAVLPWQREVPWAVVRLEMPWPRNLGARVFRGALLSALMPSLPGGEHSDWNGRDGREGPTLDRPAPICYRLRDGRPELYFLGDLAHAHARALLLYLSAVRLDEGEVVPVLGAELRHGIHTVQYSQSRWWRYRLASPFFPSRASYARRPFPTLHLDRGQRWQGEREGVMALRVVWANRCLSRSLRERLRFLGTEPSAGTGLHLQITAYQERPHLVWERPNRGQRNVRDGFVAEFLCNVDLPDGWPVGAKVSEGYGEIRRLGEMDFGGRSR